MLILFRSAVFRFVFCGFAACLSLAGCSGPAPVGPQIAGGYGESDPEEPGTTEAVRKAQQALTAQTGKSSTLVSVQAQVVAGMNYRITLKATDATMHEVIVFRPLGDRPLEVTSIRQQGR